MKERKCGERLFEPRGGMDRIMCRTAGPGVAAQGVDVAPMAWDGWGCGRGPAINPGGRSVGSPEAMSWVADPRPRLRCKTSRRRNKMHAKQSVTQPPPDKPRTAASSEPPQSASAHTPCLEQVSLWQL